MGKLLREMLELVTKWRGADINGKRLSTSSIGSKTALHHSARIFHKKLLRDECLK